MSNNILYYNYKFQPEYIGQSTVFPTLSVADKIKSFGDLLPGWDYGEGGPVPDKTVQRALAWHLILSLIGFIPTDASPGTEGEISIAVGDLVIIIS